MQTCYIKIVLGRLEKRTQTAGIGVMVFHAILHMETHTHTLWLHPVAKAFNPIFQEPGSEPQSKQ